MEELDILDSRTALMLTINKQLFRLKLTTLSDEQREGIQVVIDHLKSVLETLKSLEQEWRVSRQRNCDLELMCMNYHKAYNDLKKKGTETVDNFDEMQDLIRENEQLKKQVNELKGLL